MTKATLTMLSEEKPSIVPKVSIGMPVYNGQKFIKETLESILSQTFEDYELIISDNASTDDTGDICQSYASIDKRIRYVRNDNNIGAAKNYNQLVALARGRYFKWAAADDLIAPSYLWECVSILDQYPDVLIAHTAIGIIDEYGNHVKDYNDELHFLSETPHERLNRYLFRKAGMWNAICGLVRTECMRKTPLIGSYESSDKVLLGELVLRGKIYRISDRLFFRRSHPGQAGGAYKAGPKARAEIAAWFDPLNKNKLILPVYARHTLSYLSSVYRVPMSFREKILCHFLVLKWVAYKSIWVRAQRKVKKLFFIHKGIT